jgi:hypothetical protein
LLVIFNAVRSGVSTAIEVEVAVLNLQMPTTLDYARVHLIVDVPAEPTE